MARVIYAPILKIGRFLSQAPQSLSNRPSRFRCLADLANDLYPEAYTKRINDEP